MNNILILDGYNLIYRARYSGMNKGKHSTIFNFFRSIRPLIEKFNPDITYFVLEGKPVKRLEVDPDYKGQREYDDKDDFNRQRKDIINIVKEYFPFVIAKHNDFECDDIINHLAEVTHKNNNVTIISSDTDFIQSVNENIKLYNPIRKQYVEGTDYDYVTWKSLVGDKSDNIEGFKGIGNKKAIKLISESSKLEQFLSIEGNKTKFDKNKFMIKFHTLDEEEIENISYSFLRVIPNWERLKEIFSSYEFSSLVGKEKPWNNFINTFNNLERNIKNVN
jgi:DNA polymerase I